MNPIAKKLATAVFVAAPIVGAAGYQALNDGRIAKRTEPFSMLCDSDVINLSKNKVYLVKENSFTDNLVGIFKDKFCPYFSWKSADAQKYANDPVYRVRRNQVMLDSPSSIRELMIKELRMDFAETPKIKQAAQDTLKFVKKLK